MNFVAYINTDHVYLVLGDSEIILKISADGKKE